MRLAGDMLFHEGKALYVAFHRLASAPHRFSGDRFGPSKQVSMGEEQARVVHAKVLDSDDLMEEQVSTKTVYI
jgi:hypothetical protein